MVISCKILVPFQLKSTRVLFHLADLQVDETDSVKKSEVTQIEVGNTVMAVGYHDGSIRLFHTETGDSEVTLNGHKSSVTSLAFDESGHRLVHGESPFAKKNFLSQFHVGH